VSGPDDTRALPDEPLERLADLVDLEVDEEAREASRANLALYLRDIAGLVPLAQDAESALVRQAQEGDPAAHEQVTRSCLRLVVQVARGYVNRGLPFLDLIAEGNLGLLEAVTRFREGQGQGFRVHAAWWVRQAIVAALVEQARFSRGRSDLRRLVEAYRREARRLTEAAGRPPGPEELAKVLGVTPEQVAALASMVAGAEDDDMAGVARILRQRPELQGVLDDVAANERAVLRLRLGLDGPPADAAAVAGRLGMDPDRVRRIEAAGLRKVRALLRARGLEDADLR